jgi:hypothetical protein
MNGVSVGTRWQLDGLRTVILENQLLRVVVLPGLGARIYQLIYKPHDADLIWTHPRIQPANVPFGARYDDVWCGGWDETFPNSEPGFINGEFYPDHGELCFSEWKFELEQNGERASSRFWCRTRISDVYFEKTFTLRADEARVEAIYLLRNESGTVLPSLWNLHAPLVVSEHHRLEFPPMKIRREPSCGKTLEGAPLEFDWPRVEGPNGPFELSRIPPVWERQLYLLYGFDLAEGWCGVTNTKSGLACGFAFDKSIFSSCWVFASFGGWRNLNVAVLEPSTGHPCKVEEAIEAGRCLQVKPGQELQSRVAFSVAEHMTGIQSITPEGVIR